MKKAYFRRLSIALGLSLALFALPSFAFGTNDFVTITANGVGASSSLAVNNAVQNATFQCFQGYGGTVIGFPTTSVTGSGSIYSAVARVTCQFTGVGVPSRKPDISAAIDFLMD